MQTSEWQSAKRQYLQSLEVDLLGSLPLRNQQLCVALGQTDHIASYLCNWRETQEFQLDLRSNQPRLPFKDEALDAIVMSHVELPDQHTLQTAVAECYRCLADDGMLTWLAHQSHSSWKSCPAVDKHRYSSTDHSANSHSQTATYYCNPSQFADILTEQGFYHEQTVPFLYGSIQYSMAILQRLNALSQKLFSWRNRYLPWLPFPAGQAFMVVASKSVYPLNPVLQKDYSDTANFTTNETEQLVPSNFQPPNQSNN